ncbi:hypothetical protein J0895_24470 [Phormidium pseudopriestleyi FRX01]|uniref:Uncharacterized protein n=1 Tax=Phormidium pseudopriestleyi FRX01 TaxID=1759528 RepID=A0ABS3FZL7_9CYAN|nr:hypothetical protein [Phormidium pseudopriestleyi]MBO0352178.1 hypothetical protein [Phormidium pseudopriestleyi FRX01]
MFFFRIQKDWADSDSHKEAIAPESGSTSSSFYLEPRGLTVAIGFTLPPIAPGRVSSC